MESQYNCWTESEKIDALVDYSYWEKYVENFQEEFGNKLEINNSCLNISGDYSRNTPIISFDSILMPTQYLDLLNGHCNWILSNKNLFHYVGNYETEDVFQGNFEEIDYNLSPVDFRIKYLPPSFSNKLPFDNNRRKIAAMLRNLITYFAIHHELGHARQNSYKTVYEISHVQRQGEIWDKQAMEVDADIFSINWLWRLIYNNSFQFKSNETFKTQSELLELCLYSTLLFFYLSNNSKALLDPFNTHPHPVVRSDIITIFLKKILVTNFVSLDEFNRIVKVVIKEFDKTLVYHFGNTERHKYYKKFKSSELIKAKVILDKYLKQDVCLNCNRPYFLE